MKVSFDGIRHGLAATHNDLIEHLNNLDGIFDDYDKQKFDNLRGVIGAIMCLYDDEDPKDCNSLADVELDTII